MFYNLIFNQEFGCLQLNVPFLVTFVQTEADAVDLDCKQSQELEGKINRIIKQQSITQNHTKSPPSLTNCHQNDQKGPNQHLSDLHAEPIPKRQKELDSFTERRNIIPNNINHILAFVQRKSKSQVIVQRIIQKCPRSNFTAKKFYCYQAYLKQKLHLHVNKHTLHTLSNHLELSEDIFTVEEQLFYNRVTRILISYYIRQMAKLKILSSGRVKCTNKIDHLKAHRMLSHYLVGEYEEA